MVSTQKKCKPLDSLLCREQLQKLQTLKSIRMVKKYRDSQGRKRVVGNLGLLHFLLTRCQVASEHKTRSYLDWAVWNASLFVNPSPIASHTYSDIHRPGWSKGSDCIPGLPMAVLYGGPGYVNWCGGFLWDSFWSSWLHVKGWSTYTFIISPHC